MEDRPVLISVLLVVGACAAFAASVLGFISEPILFAILGLLGFSSVGAIRFFVESKGWKTYFVTGVGFLGSLALAFGYITPEAFLSWMALAGVGSASSLVHGYQKAIKKAA